MSDGWNTDQEDQGSGERLNPRDIVNHLVIVWPIDYIAHSPTRHSRPDKPSDVIVVDVVDLDLPDDNGYQGKLIRKAWWRQSRLIQKLKTRIGTRNLYVVVRDTSNPGMNSPFDLVNVLTEATHLARAEAWLRAHPDFVPSVVGTAEMNASLKGIEDQLARTPQSLSPAPEKSYLERLAEQAERGAARTGSAPMPPPVPPPPPQSDTPPY